MPVKITRIACQQCGANLDVSAEIRFVTCRYCDSRLEIVHDPTVSFSKQIEDLASRTGEMERELRIIRLHRQLAELEARWENFQRAVSRKGEDGTLIAPDSQAAALLPTFVSIVLVVLTAMFAFSSERLAFLLLWIPILWIGVGMTRSQIKKVELYRLTRTRYLQRRTQISGEIHGLEKSGRLPAIRQSGRVPRS